MARVPRRADATSSSACPAASATTPTSTPASITRRTSGGCSVRTIRCCPTTSGCPSAITAAPRRSIASGDAVRRPHGQIKDADAATPSFGPTRRLDYELELGIFVGAGNALGTPVADRGRRSARLRPHALQRLDGARHAGVGIPAARSVPVEELRVDDLAVDRDAGGAGAVPRAVRAAGRRSRAAALPRATRTTAPTGAFDIVLEVWLSDRRDARAGTPPQRLMRSNFRDSYWTLAQLVAHHTVNGCNLRPGDLLGTGTQSGAGAGPGRLAARAVAGRQHAARACRTARRARSCEDGDTVILRGHCERAGRRRIGFGDCAGTIAPA